MLTVEFIVAWSMPEIRAGGPSGLVSFHMSVGLLVLFVALIRFRWRLSHKAPVSPEGTPKWQEIASRVMHYALYASIIAMPLAGWAWASARGWDITLFSFLSLPPILAVGSTLGSLAGGLHEFFATVILVLVGGHVVMALYHWKIVKDGVMERMLFTKQTESINDIH